MSISLSTLECTYFEHNLCRSCSLLELSYQQQLKVKQGTIETLFSSGLPYSPSILPIQSADLGFGSRTKAKLAVSGSVSAPIIGFADNKGKVSELIGCPLHAPAINPILVYLKDAVTRLQLTPYRVSDRTGELKYFLIKAAETTGQIMLRLVCRSNSLLPQLQILCKEIQAQFPDISVVSLNIQPHPKAVIEGVEEIYLTEQNYITEKLGDTTLTYSAQSFCQVTSHMALKLYQYSQDLLSLDRYDSLLDLYCGVGAFSFFAAPRVREVTGIEISPAAVENAQRCAIINQANNCRFLAADVLNYLKSGAVSKPQVIIVNPPRRGLDVQIIGQIKQLEAEIILYSSCNPVSFKRDLLTLAPEYRLESVKGFDMFPFTEHVEVLGYIRRV